MLRRDPAAGLEARLDRIQALRDQRVSPPLETNGAEEPAAANWLALAALVARRQPRGRGLLLDIGSTTTDLVPLEDGRPAPRGRTDPERMACCELLYTGVRRTPVCAAVPGVAAELFATMQDVYLVLGLVPDDPADTGTADGRPATAPLAHARLARMQFTDMAVLPEPA